MKEEIRARLPQNADARRVEASIYPGVALNVAPEVIAVRDRRIISHYEGQVLLHQRAGPSPPLFTRHADRHAPRSKFLDERRKPKDHARWTQPGRGAALPQPVRDARRHGVPPRRAPARLHFPTVVIA